MPIYLIDKIKQKNNGTFKLVDDYDIEWHTDNTNKIPVEAISDDIVTESELADAIAKAPHMKRAIIASTSDLPSASTDDGLTIYMISSGSQDDNKYDEYVAVNGSWEKLGDSKVDLSDYYTKDDVDTKVKTVSDAAAAAQTRAENAETNAKSYADGKFLPLTGGSLTGNLILNGAPTSDYMAATKKYVDSVTGNVLPSDIVTKSDITTGTVNGTISVNGNNVSVYGLGDAAYTTVQNILDQMSIDWHEI